MAHLKARKYLVCCISAKASNKYQWSLKRNCLQSEVIEWYNIYVVQELVSNHEA